MKPLLRGLRPIATALLSALLLVGYAAGAALLSLAMPAGHAAAAEPSGPPVAAPPAVRWIPLRLVSEALGATVEWNGERRSVAVTRDELRFDLTVGEPFVHIGGATFPLTPAPVIVADRTQVPLALFTELLGLEPEAEQQVRAIAFLLDLSQGKPDVSEFSEAFRSVMPASRLMMIGQSIAAWGALGQVALAGQTRTAVHDSVEMLAQYEQVPMLVAVRFDPSGKIDDYFMTPFAGAVTPAPAPPYADPTRFTEQEVVVGEAAFPLPGTLTMPEGEGPFPAVLLVQGSGPNDRDETVAGVKLFRDLAHGLASQKVAVLRIEKRTREHSQKVAINPRLGLQEEIITDALSAVALLARTEGIDPKRIFVLGHSLGGFALPRILEQDVAGLIAGGVILAGPDSLLDTLVEQNKILFEAGLLPQEQIPFIEGQVAMLKDPGFDPDHPPAGFALGAPHYFADWRGRSSELLKRLTTPVLILQGERDCQVPVSQVESWKEGLGDRAGVTYRLYPKLNHMFTEGEGPMGLPAEYNRPANAPDYLINDIVAWIGETTE